MNTLDILCFGLLYVDVELKTHVTALKLGFKVGCISSDNIHMPAAIAVLIRWPGHNALHTHTVRLLPQLVWLLVLLIDTLCVVSIAATSAF